MHLRFLLGSVALLSACHSFGDPSPREIARTKAACHEAEDNGDSLVIGWPSADYLEADRAKGPIVVRFTGCEMKLLRECRVPEGEYEYTPLTPWTRSYDFDSVDDLHGEVPLGAAKLAGEIRAHGELSFAVTTAGMFDLTEEAIPRKVLEGDCTEATHVIRTLAVGAYERVEGSGRSASGGVEVFTSRTRARRGWSSKTREAAGVLSACTRRSHHRDGPPAYCGSVLRVRLLRLTTGAIEPPRVTCAEPEPEPAPLEAQVEERPRAPKPEPKPETAPESNPFETAAKACAANDDAACVRLGIAHLGGEMPGHDLHAAAGLFEQACARDHAEACYQLAHLVHRGLGVAKDRERAFRLWQRACDAGHAAACREIGMARPDEVAVRL